MSETLADIAIPPQFPDRTQLPESDGVFVTNFQEHPQTIILTDSIAQVLQRLHPDGQYCKRAVGNRLYTNKTHL